VHLNKQNKQIKFEEKREKFFWCCHWDNDRKRRTGRPIREKYETEEILNTDPPRKCYRMSGRGQGGLGGGGGGGGGLMEPR